VGKESGKRVGKEEQRWSFTAESLSQMINGGKTRDFIGPDF
jgi:hypothetical protein